MRLVIYCFLGGPAQATPALHCTLQRVNSQHGTDRFIQVLCCNASPQSHFSTALGQFFTFSVFLTKYFFTHFRSIFITPANGGCFFYIKYNTRLI